MQNPIAWYTPKNALIKPFISIGIWRQKRRLEAITKEEDKQINEINKTLSQELKGSNEKYFDQLKTDAENKKDTLKDRYLWERRTYFPDLDRLLPTGLGNVLRAPEDRMMDRYGLESVVVWTRLFAILPDNFRETLNDARTKLDLSARLCMIFIFSFIISLPLVVKLDIFSAVPAVSLFMAWISYNGSVNAAFRFGQNLQTAFDLYRFDLLTALHLSLPIDYKSEIQSNRKIS